METVGYRFDQALQAVYGDSASKKCAEEFDTYQQTIDRFRRGKTVTKSMILIAREKGISIDWLHTGEGSMFQTDASVNMTQGTVINHGGSPINQSGTVSGNTFNGNSTQAAASAHTSNEQPKSNLVEVTYLNDVYASAGEGSYMHDQNVQAPMAFEPSFLKSQFGIDNYQGLHIINATGDSMSPTITSGELLFVNPFENEDSNVHDGAIYIIMCSDSLLVKRVRKNPISNELTLISDNPDVENIILSVDDVESCKIVGRVVGHFERL